MVVAQCLPLDQWKMLAGLSLTQLQLNMGQCVQVKEVCLPAGRLGHMDPFQQALIREPGGQTGKFVGTCVTHHSERGCH